MVACHTNSRPKSPIAIVGEADKPVAFILQSAFRDHGDDGGQS
jgi:hypothetical protein